MNPSYKTEKEFQGYELDEKDLKPVVKDYYVYYEPKEKPVYKNVRVKEFNLYASIMAGLVIITVMLVQPLERRARLGNA